MGSFQKHYWCLEPKKQKIPVANCKFWISSILGLFMTFTAFKYPKMAFSSKLSSSGTKKSKINIKNHFWKCLAFKAQKKLCLGLFGLYRGEDVILGHFWIIITYFEQNQWSNSFWMKFPKTSHCDGVRWFWAVLDLLTYQNQIASDLDWPTHLP